ncbi:gluconate 2-dehydrogenase subunit 3 family protein [Campylobacter jejuni]|nr:gluconate 2-dehydrogenase subunit 3 family protein [Campylobacter jejuni]EHN6915824.1 gluconate 2-dehydrogenase subunit 3 family protein [Campylobacter jejuni]
MLEFFNNSAQLNILSEAVERIFPEDDLGSGTKKLGVAIFIDNELTGNYGSGTQKIIALDLLYKEGKIKVINISFN